MNRREFLKALAALPVVGLLAEKVACAGREEVDFDEAVEEIKGPSWTSAPAVTMPVRGNDRYLLNDGLESIALDGSRLSEPTRVHADDIINLEAVLGGTILHAGPLCVDDYIFGLDNDGYSEYIRLVPTRGKAMRTLSLDRQQGDWSITVTQGAPQMWASPFREPGALNIGTARIRNV